MRYNTYNSIVKEIENYVSHHPICKGFYFGDPSDLTTLGDLMPFVLVQPVPFEISKNVNNFKYRIFVYTITDEGGHMVSDGDVEMDLRYIISDMSQILNDIFNHFMYNKFEFYIKEDMVVHPFFEKFDDNCAGVWGDITFDVARNNQVCSNPGYQLVEYKDDEVVYITPKVNHNQLREIQGGNEEERYHLSLEQYNNLDVFEEDILKLNENKKDYCGFENRTDSEYYEVNTTGCTFYIRPTVDSYNIWTHGKKFTITDERSVEITEVNNITYIYFNENGELEKSTDTWFFSENCAFVAIVFKDEDGHCAITDERHSYDRDRAWHSWAHNTIGTRYKSGFVGDFQDDSFSITQGVIYDEDLRFDSQSTRTTCSIWYRDNNMRLIRGSSTPYLVLNGDIKWDNNGSLSNLTNNRYLSSYIYASNDPEEPIYCVIGQEEHVNLNGARNEPFPEIRLSTAEWKLIYKTIYQNKGGSMEFIEAVDFRFETGLIGQQAVANSHTNLLDRDSNNSHPSTAISFEDSNFEAINVKDAIIESVYYIENLNKTFEYDINDNIEKIIYSDGREITYNYIDGEIVSWTDGIKTWTINKDMDDRIISITVV